MHSRACQRHLVAGAGQCGGHNTWLAVPSELCRVHPLSHVQPAPGRVLDPFARHRGRDRARVPSDRVRRGSGASRAARVGVRLGRSRLVHVAAAWRVPRPLSPWPLFLLDCAMRKGGRARDCRWHGGLMVLSDAQHAAQPDWPCLAPRADHLLRLSLPRFAGRGVSAGLARRRAHGLEAIVRAAPLVRALLAGLRRRARPLLQRVRIHSGSALRQELHARLARHLDAARAPLGG
mmetsp:Transcript_44979/g.105077  ORF Transcript_44979/g.105077 Transcript_44979/m.105077 type:complete len:234 (-) Transcript_44979:873-1574(-)